MRLKLAVFTILALVCMLTTAFAEPSAYGGQVIVENKEVTSGTSFTVKLYISGNDNSLTSLRVPLKFDDEYLTCTYVDFSGTLKDAGMTGNSIISSGSVEISYIPPVVNPMPAISADSGLLATVYFTVSAAAPDMFITLDSANEETSFGQFGTTFHQWRRIEVGSNDVSGSMIPAFAPGVIQVHRSTDVADGETDLLPDEFGLDQNYPNPFNPQTTIAFVLPKKANVRLNVFNVLGQNIAVLADDEYAAGRHEVTWDASDAPSGIYFYRISANSMMITKKMMLLK